MKIAHISDIHCTKGQDFNERIFDKAAKLVNAQEPDFVFVSGDLTTEGLISDYDIAREKLKSIEGDIAIVPGNHDERNLGYRLFPEYFGKMDFIKDFGDIRLAGLASSEPDKDDGRLGTGRHQIIRDAISSAKQDGKIAMVGFHHHIIPIPNSGREKNIVEDAGETLDIILRSRMPIVLMGHRHVPYAVKVNDTMMISAGTLSCNRTRAHFGNTFNIIEIEGNLVEVSVMNVRTEKACKMLSYCKKPYKYENKYCE
ncbi:MAG: metallophosphoesterase [Candidatus Thermoplasmatota archaeon]|nr:metallophosphoesterase [Candidatus Thermoplasmatota archaeon]